MPSDFRCELIDGVVIELSPPGELHGGTTGQITGLLFQAQTEGLGRVLGEAVFLIRKNPDTVRAPDVAFVRADRVPPQGFARGYGEAPPDVVVEVVSPHDTRAEIQAKVREWVEFEVPLVLVVDPSSRTVEAIRSLQHRERLTVADTLDFSPGIPGFSLRVADFFA